MEILGISGTVIGSKTEIVVSKVIEEINEQNSQLNVELLDIRNFDIEICDGRPPEKYNEDTQRVVKMVSEADGYIIGTPVFHGSFPGALKNLLDLIPAEVFKEKPIGFVATGGSKRHYLMVENQLKPIASYFQSYIIPHYVFAHNSDFDQQNNIHSKELMQEIKKLSSELVLYTKLKQQ